MNSLLDTCVLSEWVRPLPAAQVIAWLDAQVEATLFISEVSLAEIDRGIIKLQASDAARARRLASWLQRLERRFNDRTLALDRPTLRLWSQLSAHADLAGQRIPTIDGLLMATAQRHGLVIVTRNARRSSIRGKHPPTSRRRGSCPPAWRHRARGRHWP